MNIATLHQEYIKNALKCMLVGIDLEIVIDRHENSTHNSLSLSGFLTYSNTKEHQSEETNFINLQQLMMAQNEDFQELYGRQKYVLSLEKLKMCFELAEMLNPSNIVNEQISSVNISMAALNPFDTTFGKQISINLLGEYKSPENGDENAKIDTCFMANKDAVITEKFGKMYALLIEPAGDFSQVLERNKKLSYSLN